MTGHDRKQAPFLVAIVGGSGSGKSWLASRLQSALAGEAVTLSLDDFYLDRSHLSPMRRARLNFDHPRAVDWAEFERTLRDLLSGRPALIPGYDFSTHARLRGARRLMPKPYILIEGLWLLRRPSLRRLFGLSIFLDCPARKRLERRLARDLKARGRTAASVKKQFQTMVEPMHQRFVEPQKTRAHVILHS